AGVGLGRWLKPRRAPAPAKPPYPTSPTTTTAMTAVRTRRRFARRNMDVGAVGEGGTVSESTASRSRSCCSRSDISYLVSERLQPTRDERLHRSWAAPEDLCGLRL